MFYGREDQPKQLWGAAHFGLTRSDHEDTVEVAVVQPDTVPTFDAYTLYDLDIMSEMFIAGQGVVNTHVMKIEMLGSATGAPTTIVTIDILKHVPMRTKPGQGRVVSNQCEFIDGKVFSRIVSRKVGDDPVLARQSNKSINPLLEESSQRHYIELLQNGTLGAAETVDQLQPVAPATEPIAGATSGLF